MSSPRNAGAAEPAVAHRYDLVVLGGGPAGTSGALAAAAFGKRVALVETAAHVGGAGLNTGTVPSKALRESALVLSGWRTRKLLGLELALREHATLAELTHHHVAVRETISSQMEKRLRERGVTTLRGRGSFVDAHNVRVVDESGGQIHVFGAKILLATGSSPQRPPEFPFEHPRVHDSDEILELLEMPRKLAVVGAGVIGAEYACTFAALGIEVHLVDGRDTLLSFLDHEISAAIETAMRAAGVRFHWKERVVSCDAPVSGDVVLTLTSGATLAVSDVLVAAGRTSNTTGLELGAAGLTPGERGLVPVNEMFQSLVPHIYAAGDIIGPPALASTGMEQARVAVCHAFSLLEKSFAPLLPTGIYTIPEASVVGITEKAARDSGVETVVGRAHYRESARGQLIGDEHGFLKLVFRRSDLRLLGVHAVGEQATELVHIGMVAMLSQADAELFSRACFNYPTLGDLYKHAAYDAMLCRLGQERLS